jgi:heme oxygenase
MAEAKQWEAFVCHFYNFYFAHTAGGIMIGKMMANKLLGGHTLHFYQWPAGDIKETLLPGLRGKIDAMAAGWTREQKDACLAETAESFRGGGSLLTHIRGPAGGSRPGGKPMH